MAEHRLSIGDSVIIPTDAKIVVKPKSEVFKYSILVSDNYEVLDRQLDGCGELTYRMLMRIASMLRYNGNNKFYISISEMCEYYNLGKSQIYSALHDLKVLRLIKKMSKNEYMVNPHFIWCGKTSEREKAIDNWQELYDE
jgi:hypothetical protein